MTTPQPGPSFGSPDCRPADCSEINLQAPVENTLPLQSLDWSPDMRTMPVMTPKQSSKRSTASSNSSVSPLVSHLPQEVANRVKKVKRTDRKHILEVAWMPFLPPKKWLPPTWMGRGIKTNLSLCLYLFFYSLIHLFVCLFVYLCFVYLPTSF